MDGQLGYKIGAGADVLTAINETNIFNWYAMMYRPSGMLTPAAITPLALVHTKGADAGAAEVRMLLAAVEYLGTFGTVDQATGTKSLPEVGIHNAPYETSGGRYLGGQGAPPFGQVAIQSGSYVGNGTGQDILLDAPAHWIYIRPLTGSTGGVHWWSSMIGAHYRTNGFRIQPDLMVQALFNAVGQAMFRVAGADTQCNAVGVTYEYVIYSDPAMRFINNGSFFRDFLLTSTINPLINPAFVPEATFLIQERVGDAANANSEMWYKGVGHATAVAARMDSGTEVANTLSVAAGVLAAQTPLLLTQRSDAYSVWRTTEPCRSIPERAVAITSYVGDGTATRNIALLLNGRFPLLAIVVPHGAAPLVRDPAHTGANSSAWTLDSTTATGIKGGGADFITVGITINGNGTIYDVFVLPGGTTGAAGWATDGTYYPVPPAKPCDLWIPDPEPPPPPPPPGSACPLVFPSDLA